MGCSAMGGGPAYNCRICPKKCSYGKHLHRFEEAVQVVDKDAMADLQQKIDDELKGCKRNENKLSLYDIVS